MPEIPTRRRFSIGFGTALAGALVAAAPAVRAAGTAADNWARIEDKTGGRLGIAVHDSTGRRYGHRAVERFPMCSTSKFLECSAVLTRVDAGHEELSRRIRFGAGELMTYSPVTRAHVGGGMTLAELCAAAMTLSDNTAANVILATLGGPAAVTAFARSIGDQVTRLDRTEPTLNEATPGDPRDTTTPDAMAADIASLVLGGRLSRRSRERMIAWLLGCRTGDARLRAGVPAAWRVGEKTGTGGWGSANDVAVIWPPGRRPLVACVYLTDTKAPLDARDAAIAAVGRTLPALLSG